MSALFCFTHQPIGTLLCEALNPPVFLYLKYICILHSLLDWGTLQIIVCVGYRDEVVIKKIMLKHYYCTQSEFMQMIDLWITFLLLHLFRLAITKGLNTYWLNTFQLFIFYSFVKMYKNTISLWHYGVLCVGQWH